MIEELNCRGEVLINVPADKKQLLELGLSESEADTELEAHQTKKELDKIRVYRDPLLVDADYSVNIALDKGISIESLRAYRQALRDITDNYQVFSDVVWPEKPTL